MYPTFVIHIPVAYVPTSGTAESLAVHLFSFRKDLLKLLYQFILLLILYENGSSSDTCLILVLFSNLTCKMQPHYFNRHFY